MTYSGPLPTRKEIRHESRQHTLAMDGQVVRRWKPKRAPKTTRRMNAIIGEVARGMNGGYASRVIHSLDDFVHDRHQASDVVAGFRREIRRSIMPVLKLV